MWRNRAVQFEGYVGKVFGLFEFLRQYPTVQAIAWKAQDRLHRKYSRLLFKGKSGAVAATAVARELLGFVWAIACQVESGRSNLRASLAA